MKTYFYTTNICFFLSCLLLVSLSGCGQPVDPEAAGKENVTGLVRLNGTPLAGAMISFIPVDSDSSAGSGGSGHTKADGKFSMLGRNGLRPGKYRVIIVCHTPYDRRTRAPATPDTGEEHEYLVNVVPPEFGDNSTLEFEVVAGRRNVFDYNIETSFTPDTSPGAPPI